MSEAGNTFKRADRYEDLTGSTERLTKVEKQQMLRSLYLVSKELGDRVRFLDGEVLVLTGKGQALPSVLEQDTRVIEGGKYPTGGKTYFYSTVAEKGATATWKETRKHRRKKGVAIKWGTGLLSQRAPRKKERKVEG